MMLSGCIICVIIYNMVGAFGYMTFGASVNTDILTNYYPIDSTLIVGMVMVALKCALTYPPVFFCPRLVVVEVLGGIIEKQLGWSEPLQRVLVTITMFTVSLILALW